MRRLKAWPFATALAAVILVVGIAADGPARAEPKENRRKAPAATSKAPRIVSPRERVVNPGGPRREGSTRQFERSKQHETKQHEPKQRDSKQRESKQHDQHDRKTNTDRGRSRETKQLDRRTNDRSARNGPNTRDRGDRAMRRAVNAGTPQLRQSQRFTHRSEIFAARALLPVRPYPGDRNFTGVPDVGETRFISTELVFQAGPNVTQAQIDEMARRHNCVPVGVPQRSLLTGGTLIRFRIADGRNAAEMVRAMEGDRLGLAQPNYLYDTVQQAPAQSVTNEQYVADKLKLAEVHKTATGKGVLIAIIDSQIDARHPEFSSSIAESFDAVGTPDKPHTHGTGMLGAIVSQGRLMGIAPDAKALAIHAFATGTRQSPQATTQAIIAGLEFALEKKARIINMSFAGPYDPMLQVALKKAAERGVILIAAVGNAGPKSPPLYPAADPNVIGVTATDQNDSPYEGANRGAYVTVAAPGVNILAPAPEAAYQLTTGTSVAAAHVSGVAALLLEKHPNTDPATILEVLTASAVKLSSTQRDDQVGFGLIDPAAALAELDARIADAAVASSTPAAPAAKPRNVASPASIPQGAMPAGPTPASVPTPVPVTEKRTLPRPGIYQPK